MTNINFSLLSELLTHLFLVFFFLYRQFKILVAEKFEAEADQLCLIFAGKILKDADTMKANNIKDGLTIHLVSLRLLNQYVVNFNL